MQYPSAISAAHAPGTLRVALHCSAPVPLQVEFDCAAGELLALVGPSGSGKSTLLRAIAGLYTPPQMHGCVRLGDTAWFDSSHDIALSPQQRRAGLVFQQYALFPHLSARDNIALCADHAGSKAQQRAQAQALLERMGLGELAHRLPHQLSGGQQQRVALARALVRIMPLPGEGAPLPGAGALLPQRPGVLLLDEPFSAVDAPMRQVLYRELAQLHASLQLPIVLVTHDLAEARRLADTVVILDNGVSLQSGPPERVLRSPRNARVAQLVGIHNHFAGQFYSSPDTAPDTSPQAPTHTPPHAPPHVAPHTPANVSPPAPYPSASGTASDAPDHTPPRYAQLRWGTVTLNVLDKGKIAHDTAVTWVLAGDLVQVLPAAWQPTAQADSAAAAQDNYVPCRLTEMLPLGEISVCKLAVGDGSDSLGAQPKDSAPAPAQVTLNLSTAQLRQLQAVVGSALTLHLPPQALHIMPVRPLQAGQ